MCVKSIASDTHDATKSRTQDMQHFVDDTILENQFLKNEYFCKMLVLTLTFNVQ